MTADRSQADRDQADRDQVELGQVQETLFIPLVGRAKESRRRRPLLRDPRAAEILESVGFDWSKYSRAGGWTTVVRSAIFDMWVRNFLAENPGGSVVELGTGLNTRFERVDNGTVHWIDLDLPDTIALRRRFFADTGRRRMVAASITDDSWLETVRELPGPYFFLADGVLPYLTEEDVSRTLANLAEQFPGALIAFDTYSEQMLAREHKLAARRGVARWQWACDDPRTLERLGLRVIEIDIMPRLPRALHATVPAGRRLRLAAVSPVFGRSMQATLFRAATSQPRIGEPD
ncbi:MAG TPA: class I SAM-dependent methyltransferase [Streptosporangiaceae bacterium]|jgi:O-methyltransferase involved in polyketide biosynthesis